MTMFGMTKEGQRIQAITPIHNTVVVDGMDADKTFGYVLQNVLLETEKSMFVMDMYGELEDTYSDKENQGYQVFVYDLNHPDVLETFKRDVTKKMNKKRMMFVQAGNGVTGQQVYALLDELRKVRWREGLHIVLDNYDFYQFPQITSIFSLWRGFRVGVSIVIQSIFSLNNRMDRNIILNNSHSLLFQGKQSKEERGWIYNHMKKEAMEHDKELLDKIASLEGKRALLVSHIEVWRKGSNHIFIDTLHSHEVYTMLHQNKQSNVYAI
ncbi:hypothetical protein COE50_06015 [Bacillus anthracis]|nr:hypothetical protein COE50_06015 [Bacillus anthracis]